MVWVGRLRPILSLFPPTSLWIQTFESNRDSKRCCSRHSHSSNHNQQIWVFLFGHRLKRFWIGRKKLSGFVQNIWKYRLMNTATAGFNTTVRQMTEMSQRKKNSSRSYFLPEQFIFCSMQRWTAPAPGYNNTAPAPGYNNSLYLLRETVDLPNNSSYCSPIPYVLKLRMKISK